LDANPVRKARRMDLGGGWGLGWGVLPGYVRGELFPHVDDGLHRAMADEPGLAPGFPIGVLGEIPLHRRQQREMIALPAEQVRAGVLSGLFALFATRVCWEEEVLDGQGGDDGESFLQAGEVGGEGGEEDASQGGREGEGGEGAAKRGDTTAGEGQGGELQEGEKGAGEGRGGWGCQQREGCWVIHAVGFEREDQLREVTSQNLGVVRGREAEVFDLRVQSVARSWGFAAGTPLALVGGGLGDGFHEEGVEVEG
jgi:hypothetical protein